MLQVGIADEATNTPYFLHLPKIHLSEHVQCRVAPKGANDKTKAEELQAWCHGQVWDNVESRPPWKVIVQRQEDYPIFEDISLYFHHAL
jgi:hypothetical protein